MTDHDTEESTDSEPDATRSLTTGRVIDAPPKLVYEAFVDPDELEQWIHPPGATCQVHHLEPEEGGTYRITMRGEAPDGSEYSHTYGGTFEEVPDGIAVTVRLEIPAAVPDEAIGGWEAALGNLAARMEGA